MNHPSVEERLTALERQVADLQTGRSNGTQTQDWRSTVGMFTGDEIMKQIDESARKIREAERRRFRRRGSAKARAKK